MYFFNSDGSLNSCRKNDTDFGWWFKDINIAKSNFDNSEKCINVCKVLCVQHQNVYLNICYDCGEYEKNNVYIPPVENILEFINENNSKEQLLIGILSPGIWKQLNIHYKHEDKKFDCIKYNSNTSDKNKIFETIDTNNYTLKLKPYMDEPVKTVLSKLDEINKLLISFKQEMNEMRSSLSDLRNAQNEEDKKINTLIESTLYFTQDFKNTRYLEDLLSLLQNNCDASIVKDWPFDSSFIGYSITNKNYIV